MNVIRSAIFLRRHFHGTSSDATVEIIFLGRFEKKYYASSHSQKTHRVRTRAGENLFRYVGYIDPEETLTEITARLVETYALPADVMPKTLIAIESGCLLGAATLQEKTRLFPDVDWTPWLAGVYVKPEHRSRGIAPLLIRAIESTASTTGNETLHLCTHEHEAYYARLGYETIEARDFRGEKTYIMAKAVKQAVSASAP